MKKMIGESLKVYEDRKINFTMKNTFLKMDLYNETENKNEFVT